MYFELLKQGETINEERYWEQLIKLLVILYPRNPASDYHLFRSMQNTLTRVRFKLEQGIKNRLHSNFFWD